MAVEPHEERKRVVKQPKTAVVRRSLGDQK
jgi:hypothetical protein